MQLQTGMQTLKSQKSETEFKLVKFISNGNSIAIIVLKSRPMKESAVYYHQYYWQASFAATLLFSPFRLSERSCFILNKRASKAIQHWKWNVVGLLFFPFLCCCVVSHVIAWHVTSRPIINPPTHGWKYIVNKICLKKRQFFLKKFVILRLTGKLLSMNIRKMRRNRYSYSDRLWNKAARFYHLIKSNLRIQYFSVRTQVVLHGMWE